MARRVKARQGLTRVSSKNQITLPIAALVAANVHSGDQLRVEVEGAGRILLVRDPDPLDEFIGALPGLSALTDLQGLRDEWER